MALHDLGMTANDPMSPHVAPRDLIFNALQIVCFEFFNDSRNYGILMTNGIISRNST